MHAWEQIQITIDYIEQHLSEDIDIESLSKIAALSPFYYQRLFMQYLIGTWLSKHKIAIEPFSLERYPSHDENTTKMELWVKPITSN